jgi:hypothetical protein
MGWGSAASGGSSAVRWECRKAMLRSTLVVVDRKLGKMVDAERQRSDAATRWREDRLTRLFGFLK